MANLASTDVTVIDEWYTGGTNSRRHVAKVVKWTAVTAGGATNKLLASALGLASIKRCSNILLAASTPKVYPAAPSADGSYITVTLPTNATDATRADLADLATGSDYAYCTVEGPVATS